jgi:hypothetical protein
MIVPQVSTDRWYASTNARLRRRVPRDSARTAFGDPDFIAEMIVGVPALAALR